MLAKAKANVANWKIDFQTQYKVWLHINKEIRAEPNGIKQMLDTAANKRQMWKKVTCGQHERS